MAEQSVTIQGQHKQANTAGTNDRKELRESLAAFVKVFLIGLIVLAAIVGGYALVDGARDVRARQARIEPVAPATQPAPTMIPAGRSGTMIAPVEKWSAWYEYPVGNCVYGWGTNPTGDNFKVRWMDRNGDIWSYDGNQVTNLRAFSVKSKSNTPERVEYEVRPRINGYCPDL